MSSVALLADARRLLDDHGDLGDLVGRWPRAVALLTRQALELVLDELWASKEPGLARCSQRAQLLALPSYLDGDVAERSAWVWWALTSAIHYHPYELAPTSTELASWIEDVQALATRVAGVSQPQEAAP